MRRSKDSYYCNIAVAVAERSTCLRRKYGAVIVKDDVIVSTGYQSGDGPFTRCSLQKIKNAAARYLRKRGLRNEKK